MPQTILAGDVGATHTRLALFDADPRVPVAFETYPSHDHAGLEDMVRMFLASHPADPGYACFGVAGPDTTTCTSAGTRRRGPPPRRSTW